MNDSLESIHDLVGAYALNAVDDAERAAFESHLDECALCREELASFGGVLDALADDAMDGLGDQAPDGLAERIGAQIALTPQVPAAPTADRGPGGSGDGDSGHGDTVLADHTPSNSGDGAAPADGIPGDGATPGSTVGGVPVGTGDTAEFPPVDADISSGKPAVDSAPAADPHNVVSFDRAVSADSPKTAGERTHADPVGRRSRLTTMLVAAAATVAVAAVGVGFLFSNGAPDENIAAIDAVLQAPDARVIDLGVGDAQITVSAEAGGFAATGNAPGLATGEEYQLWMVNADGTIDPGPTFESGDFQTAVIADMSHVDAIAVSVEPNGGSLQPTTDPIVAVPL